MEVVRWAELVRRAGTAAQARRWLHDGLWWRVLRDAYAPASVEDGPAVRAAALRLVLPDGVALSHRSALWVLGVDVLARDRRTGLEVVDVTTSRGLHLVGRSGVVAHSALLPDQELCEVDGLLAVSAARAVLPHLEPRSESLMESRLRMRLVLGGVPRPEAQVDLYDDRGHAGRSDLYLHGVVVEYDGRDARLLEPVFVHERHRQNRLADTCLEIRRFTSRDVYVRPAADVCAEVMRAVALAAERDRSGVRRGPDTLRPPRLRPLPTRADAARRTA